MAIGEFFKGVCPAAFRAYVSRNFGLFIVVSTTMILSAEFEMALSQIWWRNIMFRQTLGWIAGGLLILTGAFGGTALAVPNSAANGIRAASATLGRVEKIQYYVDDYYWDGYYWCWYEGGAPSFRSGGGGGGGAPSFRSGGGGGGGGGGKGHH